MAVCLELFRLETSGGFDQVLAWNAYFQTGQSIEISRTLTSKEAKNTLKKMINRVVHKLRCIHYARPRNVRQLRRHLLWQHILHNKMQFPFVGMSCRCGRIQVICHGT
uniref:Uncharacterized protein MANES_10G106100 n=1 Tax=Rhizophora mucronata TaxID=61149 RepID=A0A2P2LVG0_RHIMU